MEEPDGMPPPPTEEYQGNLPGGPKDNGYITQTAYGGHSTGATDARGVSIDSTTGPNMQHSYGISPGSTQPYGMSPGPAQPYGQAPPTSYHENWGNYPPVTPTNNGRPASVVSGESIVYGQDLSSYGGHPGHQAGMQSPPLNAQGVYGNYGYSGYTNY
ncbi:hypothetical protein ABW20_dc0107585 [Dactylellina cionopaga]|nr:hypothetical protein ABW20_dc0107585 [Dactylellina cionopaga]